MIIAPSLSKERAFVGRDQVDDHERGRDSSRRITARMGRRGESGGVSRVENWSLANIAPLEPRMVA